MSQTGSAAGAAVLGRSVSGVSAVFSPALARIFMSAMLTYFGLFVTKCRAFAK
jgi:hypothetical protein